jgi:hypothetical protein
VLLEATWLLTVLSDARSLPRLAERLGQEGACQWLSTVLVETSSNTSLDLSITLRIVTSALQSIENLTRISITNRKRFGSAEPNALFAVAQILLHRVEGFGPSPVGGFENAPKDEELLEHCVGVVCNLCKGDAENRFSFGSYGACDSMMTLLQRNGLHNIDLAAVILTAIEVGNA